MSMSLEKKQGPGGLETGTASDRREGMANGALEAGSLFCTSTISPCGRDIDNNCIALLTRLTVFIGLPTPTHATLRLLDVSREH
jgi:hypothetical protein